MLFEDKCNPCESKQVDSSQKLAQSYLFTTFVKLLLESHVPLGFVEKDVENQKDVQQKVLK